MGIGMMIFCDHDNASSLLSAVPGSSLIGEVIKPQSDERVILV
jgi:phosphoribosylaminoimidazole (AIR) synthetase